MRAAGSDGNVPAAPAAFLFYTVLILDNVYTRLTNLSDCGIIKEKPQGEKYDGRKSAAQT
jgi:hypothetical protein